FPLNLRRQLQRPTHSIWGINNPEVTRIGGVQSDIDLCRLRSKFADFCRKQITTANTQFVSVSPQIQSVKSENIVASIQRSCCRINNVISIMYSCYVELHCCAKIREPQFFRIAARDAFGRAHGTVQLLNYPTRKSARVCGPAVACPS